MTGERGRLLSIHMVSAICIWYFLCTDTSDVTICCCLGLPLCSCAWRGFKDSPHTLVTLWGYLCGIPRCFPVTSVHCVYGLECQHWFPHALCKHCQLIAATQKIIPSEIIWELGNKIDYFDTQSRAFQAEHWIFDTWFFLTAWNWIKLVIYSNGHWNLEWIVEFSFEFKSEAGLQKFFFFCQSETTVTKLCKSLSMCGPDYCDD